jgi:hypothetical protein
MTRVKFSDTYLALPTETLIKMHGEQSYREIGNYRGYVHHVTPEGVMFVLWDNNVEGHYLPGYLTIE